VTFEGGRLTYPAQHERLGEDALDAHLADARSILAAATPERCDEAHVNADFDHLRWFELPVRSLSR
jgi:hypothetical protein